MGILVNYPVHIETGGQQVTHDHPHGLQFTGLVRPDQALVQQQLQYLQVVIPVAVEMAAQPCCRQILQRVALLRHELPVHVGQFTYPDGALGRDTGRRQQRCGRNCQASREFAE